MKTILSTHNLRKSLLAFVLIVAGLFISANTQGACKASFSDSVYGKTIKFFNNSSAVNTNYKLYWKFSDGTTSTSKSAFYHTFPDYNKTYTVCLYLSDSAASCYDSVCTTITTGKAPCNAAYTYSANSNGVVTFTNTSTSPGTSFTSSWDFGDKGTSTSKSPTHTYTSSGTYKVCLTITDSAASCKTYYCSSIKVCHENATFTYSKSGYNVSFGLYGSPTSHTRYTWYFGDGAKDSTSGDKASHTYTTGTSVVAYLLVYDSSTGCTNYSSQTITFCSLSTSFTYSSSVLKVSFNAPTSNGKSVKYSWDFGDHSTGSGTNPTHTYSAGGTYSVCMTATDTTTGCNSKYCQNVTVSGCSITCSYTTSISGKKVTFNGSVSSGSSHLKYTWIFGDGDKDSTSGKTVTHTYTGTTLSFKAYLLVYDSSTKCSNYYYTTISFCNMSATFKYSASLLVVAFSPDSAGAKNVKYSWTFGDKATSTDASPKHTYSAAGTYSVCLTMTDTVTKCTDTRCSNITVSGCTLTAKVTDSVVGKKVYFHGSSNSTTKHIRYIWIFGDGTYDSTSNSLTPDHTYGSSVSSATCYLRVYDSTTKCLAYAGITITFCHISANFTSSASGLTLAFSPDSTNSKNVIYTWNFGDKGTSTDKSPHHTYSAGGTYNVCLYAKDTSTGCSTSYCKNVTVSSCTLTASITYSASGKKVSFKGSTNSTSSHMSYIWYFGDGSSDSSNTKTPTHTYGSSVTKANVYFRVYDSTTKCLTYGTASISFCHVSAHFTYAISGSTIKLVPDSTNSSTTKYYWSFGDKTTSKDKSPTHKYSASGKYYVCLYASDSPCTASLCDSITISSSTSTYCIKGTVTTSKVSGYPCIVYLITYNPKDSSLSAIDSVTIKDTTGKYEFCGLKNGTYYTKAALLKKHPYYKYFIPTYHLDATKWSGAQKIVINGADATGEDIKMKLGTNPGGAGFIGGKISAGANKTGDPEAGILVIIYDANDNPVAYTYSDNNGYYGISGLAFGSYSVEGEVPGKVCYPAYVTLTDSNASLNHVDLDVNISTIVASIRPAEHWSVENTAVFPNPVSDKLNIVTSLSTKQNVLIRIFDITGKVVSEVNTTISGGQQNTILDASTLNKGMYFMTMQLQKDNKILEARFVKIQ